tara:strand:- start:147 stop:806 length:660 start_codon:yes stop_codon:yes gene_type:complete
MFKGQIRQFLYSPEVESVYLFVDNCIDEVGSEVIYKIGENGGYYFPPNFSTESGIPYYYSNGKSYMPSKEEIEKEISFFVSEKLFFCTRNFIDFPNFEITQRDIKTKTTIKDDGVNLNINYPISITHGESTSIIEDLEKEIPVRLGIVYDSIEKIIKEQLSHEDICLSCILDVSLENDLYVDMMDYDEETVIFIFRDENSIINNKTYEFVFANKYEVEE